MKRKWAERGHKDTWIFFPLYLKKLMDIKIYLDVREKMMNSGAVGVTFTSSVGYVCSLPGGHMLQL